MKCFTFFCCFYASIFSILNAATIEIRPNIGTMFNAKLGEFKTKNGGFYGPAQLHGKNTTVNLSEEPKNATTFGIDASLFFNNNIGINLGLQQYKFTVNDSMATITDPSATQTLARFPNFTTEMTTFHIGGIVKQKSILNPFIGLSFATGIGKVSNTKFSPDPSQYGVGGPKTTILTFGGIVKTGVNYDLTKAVSVGIEYRYQYLKIQDTNQQFRSFNQGFTGTFKSNAILINLGYKFDI